MSEPINKDGVTIGQDRLVPKLKEGEGNVELLTSFLEDSDKLESEAFAVKDGFDKDTATGVQLDVIAKLVGEERKGRSDENFREAINSRIDANTAEGTIEDLIRIIKTSLKDSTGFPNLQNFMPSPNNPEEWTNLDIRTNITNVEVNNPTGYSEVGLVEQIATGGAADSINDGETFPVYKGQEVFIGVVAKNIKGDNSFRLRFEDHLGFLGSVNINIETGEVFSGGGGGIQQTWEVDDLGSGWKLFLTKAIISRDSPSLITQIIFEDGSQATQEPELGNQIYVQSAYSGYVPISTGSVVYSGDNLVTSPFNPEGWNGVADADGELVNIEIPNPSGQPFVGRMTATTGNRYSFAELRNATFNAGERVIQSVIFKPVTDPSISVRFRFFGDFGEGQFEFADGFIRPSNQATYTFSGDIDYKITELPDGFYLIQASSTMPNDSTDCNFYMQYYRTSITGQPTGFAEIGDVSYVQSHYVGKVPVDFPYGFYDGFQATTGGELSYVGVNEMTSPFDPSGWSTDVDGTITTVTMENPSGSPILGVAEYVGPQTFLFSRSNGISASAGESVYTSILVKAIDPIDISVAINDNNLGTTVDRCVIDPTNGDVKRDVASGERKVTFLRDGFTLFQVRFDLVDPSVDLIADFRLRDGSLGQPPAGSQMYVQGTFFGKLTDWPARYNETTNWTPSRSNLFIDSQSGLLNFVAASDSNDPNMTRTGTNYDGSVYNKIKVRWRRNSGTSLNYILWGNESFPFFTSSNRIASFSETLNNSETSTVLDTDGFYISTLDLSGDPEWNGSEGLITSIRFDFGQNNTSDFDIDYIKIQSDTLLQEYDLFSPETVTIEETTEQDFLPNKTVLAEDKSIEIIEYFPAGVHIQLQTNENAGISDLIDNSVPAGVTRTVAYSPDASEGFSFSEINVLRRFLINNNGERIVTNDGEGNLSNLVMQNFEQEFNGEGSFFAELDDIEYDPFLEVY